MIEFIRKENSILYDIETMKKYLNISKSKIQRKLKIIKCENEIVKYKNLYLYPEKTLFDLMEIILNEKLEKEND